MMKRGNAILPFVIVQMLLSCILGSCARKHVQTEGMERRIDGIVSPLVQDSLISGAILVAVNDAIAFQKAYGMANAEEDVPNRTDTRFKIASITKMFTAVAILQLYDRGALDLQDKLSRYIPEFPPGDSITVIHLLTHTSGLPSYNSSGNQRASFEDVISLIKALQPKFAPGTNFEYSNSGYALLTFIMEKVSGMPYEEYMQKNIFIPCGMTRSGVIPADSTIVVPELAEGYSVVAGGSLQRSTPRGPLGKGDGGIYSTTGDLLKFCRALLDDALISRKTRERMFQPVMRDHGMGCLIGSYKEWTIVHHPGGDQGARTSLKMLLTSRDRIIVIDLFNTDFMLSSLVDDQIAQIAVGEPGKPIFQSNEAFVDSLREYAGTYEIEPGDCFSVTVEGDSVFYRDGEQGRCPAYPYAESSIFIRERNSRYRFTRAGANGEITFVGFIGTPDGAFMVEGRRINDNKY